MLTVLRNLLLFSVGFAPALFLVGPLLFADGGMAERAFLYALTILVYLLLGFVVGLVWPPQPLSGAVWLPLAGVLVALFFLFAEARDLTGAALATGLAASMVFGALLGALAGTRVRRQRAMRFRSG